MKRFLAVAIFTFVILISTNSVQAVIPNSILKTIDQATTSSKGCYKYPNGSIIAQNMSNLEGNYCVYLGYNSSSQQKIYFDRMQGVLNQYPNWNRCTPDLSPISKLGAFGDPTWQPPAQDDVNYNLYLTCKDAISVLQYINQNRFTIHPAVWFYEMGFWLGSSVTNSIPAWPPINCDSCLLKNSTSGSTNNSVTNRNSIISITSDLRYGMRNNTEVRAIQQFLIDRGYMTGAPTGNFFGLTRAAVQAYQRANNIQTTGFVGVQTRTSIAQAPADEDEIGSAGSGTGTGSGNSGNTGTGNGSGNGANQAFVTPTLDIKVNNSDGPVMVSSGSSVSLRWTSTGNLLLCAISTNNQYPADIVQTNGNRTTGNLTANTKYEIACAYMDNTGVKNISDSVQVNIGTSGSGNTGGPAATSTATSTSPTATSTPTTTCQSDWMLNGVCRRPEVSLSVSPSWWAGSNVVAPGSLSALDFSARYATTCLMNGDSVFSRGLCAGEGCRYANQPITRSGSIAIGPGWLTESTLPRTFTYSCTGPGGQAQASVTYINVADTVATCKINSWDATSVWNGSTRRSEWVVNYSVSPSCTNATLLGYNPNYPYDAGSIVLPSGSMNIGRSDIARPLTLTVSEGAHGVTDSQTKTLPAQ